VLLSFAIVTHFTLVPPGLGGRPPKKRKIARCRLGTKTLGTLAAASMDDYLLNTPPNVIYTWRPTPHT